MRAFVRVREVDDDGLVVQSLGDRPLDVCFDGRRVWTFWTWRDTGGGRAVQRLVPWPKPLRRHLDGRSRIEVRDSATGRTYFGETVSLGSGEGRVRVRNKRGIDLGMDKSGKLVPTFAGRSGRDIAALLDATEAVIGALRSVGLEPFLAYGTLLGAVREGELLAHDSDADLGYISRHGNPVDVALESFRVQRELIGMGWDVSRHSGGAIKVLVNEGDVTRGLDVFGGFLDAGRLHLMGEIGAEFDREWLFPLTTCKLGGRPMPVPARPEKLLEATYGPGWLVPDPAFKFTTPTRTIRAFDAWFRGGRPNLRHWERRAAIGSGDALLRAPSRLARQVHRTAQELGAEVLDIGAGRGADSVWLARQGVPVTAYDFVPRALDAAADLARDETLPLDVRFVNLTEWRSVYAEGARLAHSPRPRVILVRHVLDATSGFGRASLARLCGMALRDGGRLYAEFFPTEEQGESGEFAGAAWEVGDVDVDEFTTLLTRAGASRVKVKQLRRKQRPVVRVVGEW